jgi:sugar phosphate isomerase/epimerase
MKSQSTRREFLGGVCATAAAAALSGSAVAGNIFQEAKSGAPVPKLKSPFHLAVITDEITQDFERALQIASQDFGMSWVEIRGLWNKNLLKLDDTELAKAKELLDKYQLKVTDIASPLFKVDWPGAPLSKHAEGPRDQFGADFAFKQQDQILERSMEVAKRFGTDRVRCFDFWRLDDQAPYRKAMDDKLREAAEKAGKQGIILVLENEMSCNSGTGAEAARTLDAVKSKNFMVNWDPGNAAALGEKAYPDGYAKLPKNRIGHCHCKDERPKPGGSGYEWAPVGGGTIDWAGQFRALKKDGYRLAVSLETHWKGGGTPEKSSRESWAGMHKLLKEAGAA